MARLLRYSRSSNHSLDKNAEHLFSARHALNVYDENAVYSFIPKNGCSSMRVSLAIANGCIKDASEHDWIHKNNDTFSCGLRDLVTAKYTFVILRCPFSRLASAYLDKMIGETYASKRYIELHRRGKAWKQLNGLDNVTFDYFVRSLSEPDILKGNIHWRPQSDFLVYDEYDDYFCLEDFQVAVETLKNKINLSIIDARPLTRHGVSNQYHTEGSGFSVLAPDKLHEMKLQGTLPAYRDFYTEELVEIVRSVYKQDLDLYKDIFGDTALMFQ
ncbi:sulfotransferase family 2 domain-containing protein [Solemya velum gill symbiont]|nr:sulfotransferase family 2 domain-containing protein [Solemya velum gill symbiont]OOY36125.1 hypothetical protein BOV88_00550 [Solemya velum gill symbiont]OOY38169.1 hypothetical protein BOV89_03530 [Solemya velum gill symbiont]OOY39969.1 hypothetical protein BOV90_06480 [Solemya velum gill symbiont]OOY47414.1 hypothetical protein BOV92_01470 [Solemya velum gill symbiont]OOY48837.1 hypothetical protein BOV93_01180 [Solemya velum gill symbiont]